MLDWQNNFTTDLPVLADSSNAINASSLRALIEAINAALDSRVFPRAPVAILADNSPEWIAVDLATQELNVPLIPLPTFFTPAQWTHAIESGGVQAVFCAAPETAHALGFRDRVECGTGLFLYQGPRSPHPELSGAIKITFTSGTTGSPKGVCLTRDEQWEVARAIHDGIRGLNIRRHLCLLPLSVLLENIAGVYTALLCGATTFCPPLAETGLTGASGFDPRSCLDAIQRYQAESVILLPQMLQALVAAAEPNDARVRSLKFVAVGGARTPAALVQAARDKGFPVYEGYGLTECCSVVALNLPGQDRPGSVGKPLPHRAVRISPDGEIEVRVSGQAHYLGQAAAGPEWLPTGDLGHLDEEGFLHIDGRKKNVLITSFGRNVSPEWPEAELSASGAVAQSIVFGDSQPYLVALLVPRSPACTAEALQCAVDQANQVLPDYARIRRWIAAAPFTASDGTATPNGRLKRAAIWERYQSRIAALYESPGD